MKELPKAYEPQLYENDTYKRWEESGFFNPDVCLEKGVAKADVPAFAMVLPPPNVTGTLHMGHAAMLAIQDVMARYHRMKGEKTVWIPGTDHAAIATQSKVEKILLEEEGKTRHDLGREEFLKRVDAFAQQSHDTIVNQAKKMGASLDWSREAFTLDAARNKAVNTVFSMMYDDGIIYQGDRIVNWDPKMQSNVSDDEIVRVEEKTSFYYFQYGPFVIGTARPETKFGDKYVVMHPDDARYAQYKKGETFDCEWINGPITATIIKDESVDPEFGSGVMTITPWHDTNDFDIAEKHGLDKEQVIDLNGKLLSIAGEFAGMSIEQARPKIIEKLKAKGLVVKVDEEYEHALATNYRGGGVIEPQISKQWFVDVNKQFAMRASNITGIKAGQMVTLKQLMQHVVRENNIQIIPERFEKTYFHWIDNLRDWCISRQIWYGHQVPVWYKGEDIYVGDAPDGDGWTQDPDTLDTWFSSGLWTFSTLGWPDYALRATPGKPGKENDFANYHPTRVLETGYDILFFWVARMILMSTYALGDIPFEKVYLHGLVRDEHGKKMSKTEGNVIDPLDMIAKYGTDATRLSLLIGGTPGNDMKLSEEKIAGFRNFANKLWNISRFMLMNIDEPKLSVLRPEPATDSDRYILWQIDCLIDNTTKRLIQYEFSAAGEELRNFTWGELADYYLEESKIEGNKSEILNYILNTVLKLWHPFMPFVTESIWEKIYGQESLLMVEKWPEVEGDFSDSSGKENNVPVNDAYYYIYLEYRQILKEIRQMKGEYNIRGKAKRVTIVLEEGAENIRDFDRHLLSIGGIEKLEFVSTPPSDQNVAVSTITKVGSIYLHLDGEVDKEKEKTRLQKEIDTVAPYVVQMEKKLANSEFVDNAPAQVVEAEQQKLTDAKEKLEKLQTQLDALE